MSGCGMRDARVSREARVSHVQPEREEARSTCALLAEDIVQREFLAAAQRLV